MNFQEVPKLYQCFLTHKLMQDPVVFVPKGQIFDRTSLDQIAGEEINEKNVLALPDLAAAIKQYQLHFCNTNQPEESYGSNQPQQSSSSGSITSSLGNIAQDYENKSQEVKNEADAVSAAFEELQKQNSCLKTAIKNLMSEQEKFNSVAREMESLDVKNSMEDILELRTRYFKNGRIFCLAIEGQCELLSDLVIKKGFFEKKLISLESKEEQLKNLRYGLQNLFENLKIQANFSTELEASSKKYRKPKQTNDNQPAQSSRNKTKEEIDAEQKQRLIEDLRGCKPS